VPALAVIRRLPCAGLVFLLLGVGAAPLCPAAPGDAAPAVAQGSSEPLRALVTGGKDTDLRWPDFSDYRDQVLAFYEPSGYALAWTQNGKPTAQALALIAALQQAESKGLNPEDYDASRWQARIAQLSQAGAAARFDAALTVCAMRYSSDLDVGRLNPKHFKFKLAQKSARYDLQQFVRQRLASGTDVPAALAEIEPQFRGYKLTAAVLQRYLQLAQQDTAPAALPVPAKPIDVGGSYPALAALAQRLQLLGDLPADKVIATDAYQGDLADGVKRFQLRHGLTADGRLGAQTIKQLNTPLSSRVEQLGLALERWRWISPEFKEPPVVVNIPEFRLRAFDAAGNVALSMNVIVGKAMRHETPVFDRDMQYVVFRPYWNVPPSIQRSEIVPAITRNRGYIAQKNYEVTTHQGQVVTDGVVSDEVLEQLRAGKLAVRQKPGPTNSLGLVKLIFPNEYNVYLHSTPAQQLFAQTRRDFSHGCIRVEKPEELAAWVLQGRPEWSVDKVREAMSSGRDNLQVNLPQPIPVLILYVTAVPTPDGSVLFYDDIYGHDASLRQTLAKGYPYP
jgi:murein L,D-transpeptidase YcbB/YkuD